MIKNKRILTFSLLVIMLTSTVLPLIITNSAKAATTIDSGWTLISDARALKANPDLREYVWQKNATMAPNGQYDKIGLHRLVKATGSLNGAIFINPGTYGNGEQFTTNPTTDNYSKTETNNIAIYWANRGFDVYAIDYRTHFVPITLNASQLGFMANWGWDQWISDIKEAVTKTKEVSGSTKVFMVGFSFGGIATMNYATKFGQDLRGIVLLDGGWANKNPITTNTFNLPAVLNGLNAAGVYSYEYPNLPTVPAAPTGYLLLLRYAAQNPGAPAEYPPGTPLTPTINPLTNKTWTNITEWLAIARSGAGSNTLAGYGNVTVNQQQNLATDRYWPQKIYAELGAYRDWTNCPQMAYDFDDHFKEIDVPFLGFTSELFGAPFFGNYTNGIASNDFTTKFLPKYGHADLIQGTNSAKDVSQPALDWMILHSTTGWTLTTNARSLKAYSSLQETIWQKTAAMPPNGQYDQIGLHRLVNPNIASKGVIFVNPGTYGSGEKLTSNPPSDNYTLTENNDEAIYWANHGYDVYAIDYRTHFVPPTLNTSQLGFMANWGWDQWISDIREAVTKTKEVSGSPKVFMAGQSFGGRATMNYAAKYWQEDLRGIILLDGSNATKNTSPTNTYNLTAALAQENAAANWALITPNLPGKTPVAPTFQGLMQFAAQNPGAPAKVPGTNIALTPTISPLTNKPWANITEWAAFTLSGSSSNIIGGYSDVTNIVRALASMDRYWPDRLNLEQNAFNDWQNCPYVKCDFDEYYNAINVPLKGYISEFYGVDRFGSIVADIANPDVAKTLLLGYGHMDVFMGTYSVRDISEPVLQWMTSHYQPPSASAFCSATVMTGQSWYFFAHSAGSVGPNTYQWYEGTTLLAGQTSMLLQVTKATAGTYTYTCKISDNEGTKATSNTVTLTVLNK